MRGGGHQKLKARRRVPVVEIFGLAGIVSFCSFAGIAASAGDLRGHAEPPAIADPPVISGPPGIAGPSVIAGPPCRFVPRPETDIFGVVVRFRPTWVCVSRGLYADRLPPPPPRRRRPWWGW